MAKRTSKPTSKSQKNQKGKRKGVLRRFAQRLSRPGKINPHKSFKRTYREDYRRETKVPGIAHHIAETYRILFKNWKIFGSLLAVIVLLSVLFVGVMNESSYVQFQEVLDETTRQATGGDVGNVAKAGMLLVSAVSTGGLSGDSNEAAMAFGVLILLVTWLTTIYLLRHRLAGHVVKMRDGLYNAMTPLISSLVVLFIAIIQCVPIFILTIVYSAAVQTEFLATPFYALLFFIFALLMITISGYLLSSSLMALVATTAPGMYPMKALQTASDLMMGRRVRFVIRLIALFFVVVLMWTIVMLPVILFDLWLKSFEWAAGFPLVPICFTVMTWATAIYVTTYLYLYYRWLLEE